MFRKVEFWSCYSHTKTPSPTYILFTSVNHTYSDLPLDAIISHHQRINYSTKKNLETNKIDNKIKQINMMLVNKNKIIEKLKEDISIKLLKNANLILVEKIYQTYLLCIIVHRKHDLFHNFCELRFILNLL